MSLERALGSRNRVRVLRALFRADGVSGRQVAALAGIAPSASKAALEELVACSLVLCTRRRGRHTYELNQSHHLLATLRSLFLEEHRLPGQLAELIRRHLRQLSPPRELLAVGISADGSATLAVYPEGLGGAGPSLERELKATFGLRMCDHRASAASIPEGERVWTLASDRAGAPGALSRAERERALRFFGIPPRGPSGAGSGRPEALGPQTAGGGRP